MTGISEPFSSIPTLIIDLNFDADCDDYYILNRGSLMTDYYILNRGSLMTDYYILNRGSLVTDLK